MIRDRNFWIGLAAGAAAGAASAFLFAPKSGEDIRGEIKHTTENAGRKAGEAWSELRERSSDVALQAQAQVLRTADVGVEKVSHLRDKLHQTMEADKRSPKQKAEQYEANASDTAQVDQL